MRVPAAGPWLDRGAGELPITLGRGQKRTGNGIGTESPEEALLALEDRAGAGETLAGQQRREHARFGGPRRMEVFAHCSGGQELPQARCLGPGITEGPDTLLLVEI